MEAFGYQQEINQLSQCTPDDSIFLVFESSKKRVRRFEVKNVQIENRDELITYK